MLTGQPLKLGMIAFNNAAPYRLIPPAFPVEWVSGDPSELSARMRTSDLDACLLPTGALPGLEDSVRPLGPYGIGCRGQVLSVRLFSQLQTPALLEPQNSIFVTPRSTTTRLLLSELFTLEHGKRPQLASSLAGAEGRVLIGDEAMDLSREEFRWPVSRDLGEWWFEQTALPFVFAQWTVRRGLDQASIAALQGWIEDNLAESRTPRGKASLRQTALAAHWSEAQGELYFDLLHFRLTQSHEDGLARFLQLIRHSANQGDLHAN